MHNINPITFFHSILILYIALVELKEFIELRIEGDIKLELPTNIIYSSCLSIILLLLQVGVIYFYFDGGDMIINLPWLVAVISLFYSWIGMVKFKNTLSRLGYKLSKTKMTWVEVVKEINKLIR